MGFDIKDIAKTVSSNADDIAKAVDKAADKLPDAVKGEVKKAATKENIEKVVTEENIEKAKNLAGDLIGKLKGGDKDKK